MSTVIETSDSRFSDDVAPEGTTVVDFWAAWCGPCRAFAPVFAASAGARPEVRHLKVDVDQNPALAQYFQVSSIPTVVLLRDGLVLSSVAGALSPAALSELIDAAQATDMEEARAQAEADRG